MEKERDELAQEKETLAQKVSEGEMTSAEYSVRMQEIQDQYRSVQARLDEKETEAEGLRNNLLQTVAEKDAQVSTIEVRLRRSRLSLYSVLCTPQCSTVVISELGFTKKLAYRLFMTCLTGPLTLKRRFLEENVGYANSDITSLSLTSDLIHWYSRFLDNLSNECF